MSKKLSRHIPNAINDLVQRRAKGQCECCGSMQVPDRHHIFEYSLGGKHSEENIILLCPSCHRDVPKFLNQNQQKALQEWNIGFNKGASFKYNPKVPGYAVGTILFIGSECIIKAGDQNIISVTYHNGKLYLNAVMLNNFKDKLLILSNRVITSDEGVKATVADDEINVTKNGSTILVINNAVKIKNNLTGEDFNAPWIRGRFIYKDKFVQFDEQNVIIPGAISSAIGTRFENLDFILDIESGIMKFKIPKR